MPSTMYEFRVDGRLPEQAREAFADLRIEEVPEGLLLRGPVIDDSHLHGIIERFRSLGLRIVFAQPMDDS